MKQCLILIFAVILTFASAVTTLADVTVREKQTMSGQTMENTTYIKGKRQRTETMSGAMVSITQCDARREIRINPALQTYSITPFDDSGATRGSVAPVTGRAGAPVERGGTVTMTSTIRDTGETKQMFGYTARHILTNVVFASSPDACSVNNTRIETDGWYIDDNFGFDCGDTAARYKMPAMNSQSGCRDRYVTKTLGTARKGLALIENTAIFSGEDGQGFRFSKEVVELSKAELDPALFDIPEGYSLASDDGAVSNPALAGLPGVRPRGTVPTSSTASLPVPSDETPSTSIGAKREGVLRVGIGNMRVTAVEESISSEDLASAFRATFIKNLSSPSVEVVLLEGQTPSAIEAEAKSYECDFVIYGEIAHKKGGSGFGSMLGKVVAPAAGSAAAGATGTAAGVAASQAVSAAMISASNIAANIKAKDEITFGLRLVRADGSVAAAKQFKRKAKSNGEDLVTPIVDDASAAVTGSFGR